MLYGNYMEGNVKDMFKITSKAEKSHQVSRWGSEETQVANFNAVINVLKQYQIKDILDVGCGLGDIQKHIAEQIHEDIDYFGIDITPEVVERANCTNIAEADILDYHGNNQCDAVIALGTFNMGVPWQTVHEALNRMFNYSSVVTVVTISYVHQHELEQLQNEGWTVITHPYAFSAGYGDKHILIKAK